jgi:hypothetical protein
MATYTVDWDGTSTLTREKVIPRIKDQFFKKNVLMYRIRPKAEMYSGGAFIRQPLSFSAEGGGGAWFAGTDKFDIRVRNPFTSATFQSKNFELPIVITQDEEDAVDGPESFTTLLAAKMKIAERTIMDSIGGPNGIYNNGTNPKAITGLQASLPDSLTTGTVNTWGGAYGGISQASGANAFWNHQIDSTAYITGSGGATNYIQAKNMAPWDTMISKQALASGKYCSMILCNWGVFNELSQIVNSKTTFFRPQQDTELAKLGYLNYVYRNITIVVDEQVPRGVPYGLGAKFEKVYFIDESALHLWIHTARNFAFEGWRKPVDQALRVAYLWFRGEMSFDERRSSGVHCGAVNGTTQVGAGIDTSLTS